MDGLRDVKKSSVGESVIIFLNSLLKDILRPNNTNFRIYIFFRNIFSYSY